MNSIQSSTRKSLQVDSTERSRDRSKRKVEEEKKLNKEVNKANEIPGQKRGARSNSPSKTVKSPRRPPLDPARDDGEAKKGRRSGASMETKKDKESQNSTTAKSSKTPTAPTKGTRGRPLGWRKGMASYLEFKNGNTKISPVKANSIKKKKKGEMRTGKGKTTKKKSDRKVMSERAGTRKKTVKPSPMKTRALQKKCENEENSLVARCVLCRSKEGVLQSCAECNAQYHLRKCCRYSDAAVNHIESGGLKRWLCARCISCALCSEYISDPHNVECSICTMTFHGKCGEKSGKMIDGTFSCDRCMKNVKPLNKSIKKEEINEEKQKIENTWKRGRKAKGYEYFPGEIDEEKKIIEERDGLYNDMLEEVEKKSVNANSPSKAGMIASSPQKIKIVALESDLDLYESAKAALAAERKAKGDTSRNAVASVPTARKVVASSSASFHSSLEVRHQWIYVGSKKDKMKSIYASPYPQEIVESENVFICPFCLRANSDQDMFRIHQKECTWNCPPGNEIYRDNEKKLSFFEVDGASQKLYCRRVCLLGKLFISSKTLVDEVETFLFYVLVEHDNDGCEFVGYFSKEKNPSKNNNLSCILTLPSAMRSGYGRLLIDLSYELSRIEKKIGSPEHPLSDLGLIAYMGFWRSSILCYLRSLRGTQVASVKQISLATRIAPQDVINQLMRDGLLFYKDGVYFVNTEQRAYRMPLGVTRRKTIDHSKLKWEPSDGSHQNLDSSRLNYYV